MFSTRTDLKDDFSYKINGFISRAARSAKSADSTLKKVAYFADCLKTPLALIGGVVVPIATVGKLTILFGKVVPLAGVIGIPLLVGLIALVVLSTVCRYSISRENARISDEENLLINGNYSSYADKMEAFQNSFLWDKIDASSQGSLLRDLEKLPGKMDRADTLNRLQREAEEQVAQQRLT